MLAVPFRLAAQAPADSARPARAATGDTLRGVELDRRDIFDPSERGWVAHVGNALHIQTRAATIRRELQFEPGQPYDSARVAESERNLRALGVFRIGADGKATVSYTLRRSELGGYRWLWVTSEPAENGGTPSDKTALWGPLT